MRRVVLVSLVLVVGAAAAYVGLRQTFSQQSASPEAGGLHVVPDAIDFGVATLGVPVSLHVIATNLGESPLVLDRMEVDAPFEVSSFQVSFAAGAAREISVKFDPAQPGEFTGNLRLVTSAVPGGVYEVPLTGRAVGPASLSLAPRSLDFGDVAVGGVGRALLTVSNSGASALTVEARPAEHGILAQPAMNSIEPGESATLEVQYRPERLGPQTSRLWIRSNEPGRGDVAVPARANGVAAPMLPAIEVSPSALEFGKVALGSRSRRDLSIRNVGSDPLSISSLSATRPFSSSLRSRTLAPNTTLVLPVTCEPHSSGMHFAPLVIASNDPDAPMQSVALFCDGQAGAVVARSETGGLGGAGGRVAGRGIGGVGATGEAADGSGPSGFTEGSDGPGSQTQAGPAGSEAAFDDSSGSDDGSGSDGTPLGGGSAGLNQDSLVHLASFEVPIPDSLADVGFDSGSRQLSISNLQLPTVDGGINGAYSFDPVTVSGTVDALGEFNASIPVVFHDTQGSTTEMVLDLTTDTAVAPFHDAEVAFPGRALTGDNIKIVGAAQVPSGPLAGWILRVELDVRVQ